MKFIKFTPIMLSQRDAILPGALLAEFITKYDLGLLGCAVHSAMKGKFS